MSRITVVIVAALAICKFASPLQTQAGVRLDQLPGIISRDPLPYTRFINNETLNIRLKGNLASYPIRVRDVDAQATFVDDVCMAVHWASNGETFLNSQQASILQRFASRAICETPRRWVEAKKVQACFPPVGSVVFRRPRGDGPVTALDERLVFDTVTGKIRRAGGFPGYWATTYTRYIADIGWAQPIHATRDMSAVMVPDLTYDSDKGGRLRSVTICDAELFYRWMFSRLREHQKSPPHFAGQRPDPSYHVYPKALYSSFPAAHRVPVARYRLFLMAMLAVDNPHVDVAIIKDALKGFSDGEITDLLIRGLNSNRPQTIERRAMILESRGTPKALKALVKMLENGDTKYESIREVLRLAIIGIVRRHPELDPVDAIPADDVQKWHEWKSRNL